MDAAMVDGWNRVVGKNDIVFHLGDVGFWKSADQARELISSLNGDKRLVLGNHDLYHRSRGAACRLYCYAGFQSVYAAGFVYLGLDPLGGEPTEYFSAAPPTDRAEPVRLLLSHWPAAQMRTPPHPATYDFNPCGHVHGLWLRRGRSINVGVDVRGFAPITIEEALATPAL